MEALRSQLLGDALADSLIHPAFRPIPARLLYDDRGSELFEKITQLQEYYVYEEERKLLR